MSKNIILTVLRSDLKKEEVTHPEGIYYWKKPKGKVVVLDFLRQINGKYTSLFGTFVIPSDFTSIVPSEEDKSGYAVKLSDSFLDWNYINSIDPSQFRDIWPTPVEKYVNETQRSLPEIYHHIDILISGRLRLVSAWLSKTPPDITPQIEWWENFLEEELYGFPLIYRQIKRVGFKGTLQRLTNKSAYQNWLKSAYCCVEILSSKQLLLALQLDKGKDFPCLWQGFQQFNDFRSLYDK